MKKKLVVLTGAGMSAESGISTFRDSGGLWDQYRVEDVATPEGFHASINGCDDSSASFFYYRTRAIVYQWNSITRFIY